MRYFTTEITSIGDPFVLLEGSCYYMYATSSPNGFLVWKGESLDNLQCLGLCYKAEQSFGNACFWAPEVVRRYDGKYVMHFTAKCKTDGILRTGVAISDSPEGPFVDVDGKPMFSYDFATIDASCYVEGEQAWLYFVKDCSMNIVDGIHTSQVYVARLDKSLTKLVSEPKLVLTPTQEWETHSLAAPTVALTEEYSKKKTKFLWNEGPSLVKHNDKYYLTYSANCYDSRYYSVGVAVADSPEGPFQKAPYNPILQFEEGKMSGPGHNSYFTDKQGNLMTAFHIHTDYNHPSGNRRFCYCSVSFRNGKMILG